MASDKSAQFRRAERKRLAKANLGFQGDMSPWSQDEVREGEAVSLDGIEANVGRGKSVPPPRKRGNGVKNPTGAKLIPQ